MAPYILSNHNSRACYGRKLPRLVASTESHKIQYTYQGRPTKPHLKDKHSYKLPEEPIQAVVSVLSVLTDLCNVNLQIFPPE